MPMCCLRRLHRSEVVRQVTGERVGYCLETRGPNRKKKLTQSNVYRDRLAVHRTHRAQILGTVVARSRGLATGERQQEPYGRSGKKHK